MNYIIFDLEATCWDQHEKKNNETIEIGAVLVNGNKEITSEFEQFIKPVKYPKLSEFCINLTSIKQSNVDKAPYFGEAIDRFKKWFQHDDEDYVLCSWGFYDKRQFESDCKIHGLDTDWIEKHVSLKHQYGKIKNLKRPIGMKNALVNEKMNLDGTHHRGIDDARNIAKIFLKYFDHWKY